MEKTVDIAVYDWYTVEYYDSDIYIADILSIDNPEEIGVVGAFIYPVGNYLFATHEMFDLDYLNSNIIEILYLNQQQNFCTKIIAPLNNEVLKDISIISENLVLRRDNTDELSETLIQSYSFETWFKSSMYDETTTKIQRLTDKDVQIAPAALPSYGSFANSNESVFLNSYDKYTDFDGFIHEYETTYKDKVHTFYNSGLNIKVSDDPIVNIIPKSLFIGRWAYSYIGKEYGFYVKTVQDYGNDNVSDFIVFDIETVSPYPGRTAIMAPPSITVRPLFSGRVKYLTDWGGVVVYDGYYEPNLALANIQIAGAINNIDEKNIGDTGYIASQDYGYAFGSYAFEAVGTGIKRDKNEIDLGWMKTLFGATKILNTAYPGVGTAISTVGKALTSILQLNANHYISSSRTQYNAMDKLADGSFKTTNIVLGNSNTVSMINNYGNLVKGFETEMLDSGKTKEENYPLL